MATPKTLFDPSTSFKSSALGDPLLASSTSPVHRRFQCIDEFGEVTDQVISDLSQGRRCQDNKAITRVSSAKGL
jgi:hypothetical protein